MYSNDCIAMVLAGGRGERLGALTRYFSKPAVYFGVKNRIIDYTLNNCRRSEIDTIGILSQHFSIDLHAYIEASYNGNLKRRRAFMLPPQKEEGKYTATADAVYKNIDFIESFRPEHVLILAGDHIYKMDYRKLMAFHKEAKADVTIASTTVSLDQASRFGILSAGAGGRIYGFEEKPLRPRSTLASMGIYAFRWEALKERLIADSDDERSHHDFGKDIIPTMLASSESLYAYRFDGYWRDVGTLDSLWEANMDLLAGAGMNHSIIAGDTTVLGKVKHSILADLVTVDAGAEVTDSVIMPGAYIGRNARVHKAIVGVGAKIMAHAEIGSEEGTSAYIDREICRGDISLVAPWTIVPRGMKIRKSSQICEERLHEWEDALGAMAGAKSLEAV